MLHCDFITLGSHLFESHSVECLYDTADAGQALPQMRKQQALSTTGRGQSSPVECYCEADQKTSDSKWSSALGTVVGGGWGGSGNNMGKVDFILYPLPEAHCPQDSDIYLLWFHVKYLTSGTQKQVC